MKWDFDKVAIVILILVVGYFIFDKLRSYEESHYYIDNKPYKVCDKEIYITDYTYNQTLDVKELLEDIEYICTQ